MRIGLLGDNHPPGAVACEHPTSIQEASISIPLLSLWETKLAYTADFYDHYASGCRISAREVIPEVLELIGPVHSVLDIGCGIGTWLVEFADRKITDFVGVDGSYVDHSQLLIPSSRFVAHDLTTALALDRTFDLVCSLEVAEHIEPRHAATFVKSLSDHASEAILFSAAIPGQGGEHHVNEQWPSFWAPIFADQGFSCFDVVRPRIWNNPKIYSWYRQNALLFARGKTADHLRIADTPRLLDVVHPAEFDRHQLTPRDALRSLLRSSFTVPMVSALKRTRQFLK